MPGFVLTLTTGNLCCAVLGQQGDVLVCCSAFTHLRRLLFSVCNIEFSWNMLLNLSTPSGSTICLPYQHNIHIIYSLTSSTAFVHSFASSCEVVSRIDCTASWTLLQLIVRDGVGSIYLCEMESTTFTHDRWSPQHLQMRDRIVALLLFL